MIKELKKEGVLLKKPTDWSSRRRVEDQVVSIKELQDRGTLKDLRLLKCGLKGQILFIDILRDQGRIHQDIHTMFIKKSKYVCPTPLFVGGIISSIIARSSRNLA